MEAAGHRVCFAAELASRMQRGHHGLDAGESGCRVFVYRYAATVILDGYNPVRGDCDLN